MQNLPDGDEAAEFSEVLKSFYKTVYEGQDEQLPAILKVFKNEKASQKVNIKENPKSNGHYEPLHENVPNGYIEMPDVNGTDMEIPITVNGFPHRDSLALKGFPHRDSLDLRDKGEYKLNDLQFSNGVNPVLIISPDEFNTSEKEDKDDSGFQNGISEGTHNFDATISAVESEVVIYRLSASE